MTGQTTVLMRRIIDILGAGILTGGLVSWQIGPQQELRKTVTGYVVDATSGRPIEGARVILATKSGTRRVTSTATGHFVVDDVYDPPIGLSASKAGYLDGRYGQRFPGDVIVPRIELTVQAGKINLRLWRLAVVRGRVHDEAGEPLVGVSVKALRVALVGGRKRLVTQATTKTDDKGEYGVSVRPLATYVIAVLTPTIGGGVYGTASADKPLPTVFYPSTLEASASIHLQADPGAEYYNIDIAVPNQPTQLVSGHVAHSDCDSPVVMELLRDSALATDLPTLSTKSTRDCSFSFGRVPRGQYVLRAVRFPAQRAQTGTQAVRQVGPQQFVNLSFARDRDGLVTALSPLTDRTTLWARLQVVVADQELNDLNISLQPGATLSGRFVFDKSQTRPAPDTFGRTGVIVSAANGESVGSVPVVPVEPDGRFETVGLPPGRYVVFMLPLGNWNGWSVRSIAHNGVDVLGSSIDLGAKDIRDIVVNLTTTPPTVRLSGTVKRGTGQLASNCSVYVFPTDRRYWVDFGQQPPWRLWEARSDDAGRYSLSIQPGEYYIVATDAAKEQWRDPDLLTKWVGFARVIRASEGSQFQDVVVRPLPW
jgi:hypothetical protein